MSYYKVGNEIFQWKDYLMRSYLGTRSGKLLIGLAAFNYRLSRTQQVIKNSFGIFFARWRLFCKPICDGKENFTSYILARDASHNFPQQNKNASYCPRGFVDYKANSEFWPRERRWIVHDDVGCFMSIGRYQGPRYEKKMRKMLSKWEMIFKIIAAAIETCCLGCKFVSNTQSMSRKMINLKVLLLKVKTMHSKTCFYASQYRNPCYF